MTQTERRRGSPSCSKPTLFDRGATRSSPASPRSCSTCDSSNRTLLVGAGRRGWCGSSSSRKDDRHGTHRPTPRPRPRTTLRVEPFPVDEELSPTDGAHRTRCCLCCCGLTTPRRPRLDRGLFVVREPMVLGHEAAGVVVEQLPAPTPPELAARGTVCAKPGHPSGWSTANVAPATRGQVLEPPVHGVIRPQCRSTRPCSRSNCPTTCPSERRGRSSSLHSRTRSTSAEGGRHGRGHRRRHHRTGRVLALAAGARQVIVADISRSCTSSPGSTTASPSSTAQTGSIADVAAAFIRRRA